MNTPPSPFGSPGSSGFQKLDLSKLERVRERGGRTAAACPACRENGGDKAGEHLIIFEDGRFACAAFQGDREHAREILRLAGHADWRQQQPRHQGPYNRQPQSGSMALALPPQPLAWAADCSRLANNPETLRRAAAWRGYDLEFLRVLAEGGVLGLHGGRLCFPVRDEAGLGRQVLGRQVFSWPEERLGEEPKGDAWFSPAGVKPLPPLLLGVTGLGERASDESSVCLETPVTALTDPPARPLPTTALLFESQWDALAVLQSLGWQGGPLPQLVIITRGTSPTVALREALTLAGVDRVWLWMQNDAPKADGSIPAQQWRDRCLALLPAAVTRALQVDVPPNYKDWNDALRGLDPAEFSDALAYAQEGAIVLTIPLLKETAADADLGLPWVNGQGGQERHQAGGDHLGAAGGMGPLHPSQAAAGRPPASHTAPRVWQEPRPLPTALAPVPAFDVDSLLPDSLRAYVRDCAERLQVDASFVAVPLIVSLGAVMGNRLGLRPKMNDDWTEYPNVWGAIIGRPSTLKSPSCRLGMRPVVRLETIAGKDYEARLAEYKKTAAICEVTRNAAKAKALNAAKKGENFDPSGLTYGQDDEEPAARRIVLNDSTPEALHKILCAEVNATGAMIYSDELCGLLARLNDPDRGAVLRAFMLSAWSGDQAFVMDRIIRGENLRVERCCLSILGGIQPGKLAPLVDGALSESIQDDGWLQRLSLLVWPDPPPFEEKDIAPDQGAYMAVLSIFHRAEYTPGEFWPGAITAEDDALNRSLTQRMAKTAASPDETGDGNGNDNDNDHADAPTTGAAPAEAGDWDDADGDPASLLARDLIREEDPTAKHCFLRFEPAACAAFKDWLTQETQHLRSGQLSPALESHFFKYRKTVCSLALLFHICGDLRTSTVSLADLQRALRWLDYLKPHAIRVYGAGTNTAAPTAQRILDKLRSGELSMTFKARDLKQHQWSGLTDGKTVNAALKMLVDHGWLVEEEITSAGRATKDFQAHPSIINGDL